MTTDPLSPEDRARVDRAFAALKERGVEATFTSDRPEALAVLLAQIPKGALVSHGTSTTLQEIGLVDRLNDPTMGIRYGNAEWMAESDPARRMRLRAQITAESDVFLGSVQAICETGQVVCADMAGSRQMGYIYGPPKVIWVAGLNKLVPDLEAGIRRVREVALPLEDRRVKASGGSGSAIGKLVIYEKERPGRISLLLVGEELGF